MFFPMKNGRLNQSNDIWKCEVREDVSLDSSRVQLALCSALEEQFLQSETASVRLLRDWREWNALVYVESQAISSIDPGGLSAG